VFGRKKTLNDELAPTASTDQSARPGAKNRPTPKRREQEALNKRPLIVTDRKAATKQDKTVRREAMAKQRAGMMTGDEKYLPARDKGPRRRFIRDTVDARWNIGEFMLPIMLIVLLLSFVRTNWALLLVFVLVYGLILVAIGDALLMWRRTRRKMDDKFGGAVKGDAWYAIMRAFQMRRTRMPKPQVARGEHPA
jgi:Flp pilus assembly protein TadB